jgi:hypothetical protein
MADEDDLFEDMADGEAFDLSEDSDDRALLYAIWTGSEIGDLPMYDGWRILYERYPDDMRLLVALSSEEIQAVEMGSPEQVCAVLEKILDAAKGKLNDEVRDLLAFARLDVADDTQTGVRLKKPLSPATAKRVAAIRSRVGKPTEDVWDEGGPAARLASFRRNLVRVLHDATRGNKPIKRGATKKPDSWRDMLAAAKTKTKYAPDATFEPGDAVEHAKFGVGVVTGVESGRVTILFESGERKLVMGAG